MEKADANNIHKLAKIIGEIIEDLKISDQTDIQYVIRNMIITISNNNGVVLVDDFENPKCLIWGVANSSALLNRKMFMMPLIYVRPDFRGNSDLIETMMNDININSAVLGCNMVVGASWQKGDTVKNSASMWKKSGYTKMETMYMKEF